MRYSIQEIQAAVDHLATRLKCPVNAELQQRFEAGYLPWLLAHDRLLPEPLPLPILARHLMGALSCAHQPVTFYDIHRVCRSVTLVLALNAALQCLDRKGAENLDTRLDRLVREDRHEGFDAVLFEIVTAGRYAQSPDVERITFIRETPKAKTPDLLIVRTGGRMLVECKKSERIREHHMGVRDRVRELLNPICSQFRQAGKCVSGEVTFHAAPEAINPASLARAFRDALRENTTIITDQFTVAAQPMLPWGDSSGPTLYPSPFFNWSRYGYRVRSDWFGLVHQANVQHGHWCWDGPESQGGLSSWVLDSDWDAGIKWRIDNPDLVDRYRRFAFNTVFKGLNQLQRQAGDTGLHVWLESDYFLQGRREILLDLFQRLKASEKDQFSWVVVNETLFDISPGGNFDLIEHAHTIKGPKAAGPTAPASSVFTIPDEEGGSGEFGVGCNLPDIDTAPGNSNNPGMPSHALANILRRTQAEEGAGR